MKPYSFFNKLEFIGYRLKTDIWYKLFLKSCGKNCAIYKPVTIQPEYLTLGNRVFIKNNARIQGVNQGRDINIIIEDDVNIEQNIHLTCSDKIFIGKNTAIAANVSITDIKHSYEDVVISPKFQQLSFAAVTIGQDCTIYNNSVILPGTVLGRQCTVAANSVVLGKTYPDYCVLAGNPAIIIKRYSTTKDKWLKTHANGDFIN